MWHIHKILLFHCFEGCFSPQFALLCKYQQVNIGMIGGGTVGSGVFHHLRANGSLLESRLGVRN